MMIQRSHLLIQLMGTAFLSLCAAYSFVLRFTHFFMLSKIDKTTRLGFIWILVMFAAFLFITPAIYRLISDCRKRLCRRFFILSAILALLSLLFFYRIPDFPKKIDVVISPMDDTSGVTILSINRVDGPKAGLIPIPFSNLQMDDGWDIVNDGLVYSAKSGQKGSVRYTSFVQDRLIITFKTNPDQGAVEVSKNKEITQVDLDDETPGEIVTELAVANTWQNADRLRKLMLTAGVTTDFVSITAVIFFLALAIHQVLIERRLRFRGSFSLGLLLVISAVMLLASNHFQREVIFREVALEEVVRQSIDQPSGPIYTNQLLTVIEIDLHGKNIEYLDGIEALRNLRVLNLENNHIRDFSPLGKLTKLQELDLSNNSIQGIAGLPELPSLQILGLRYNRIRDISRLADFRRLEYLDLRNNRITDISALAGLKRLKSLNLRDNQVADIAPLAGLTKLNYLNLHSNTSIENITPLQYLINLQKLILRNIQIGEQAESLTNLVHLDNLNIRNCGVSDISFLVELLEKGALQDDQMNGVYATVNMLDNPITSDMDDPYQGIRAYWDSITYRYPVVLPYFENNISAPIFSHSSGFYDEAFNLMLSTGSTGDRIFYTLDGSIPVFSPQNHPQGNTLEYRNPIQITDRSNDENVFSMIESSKINNYYPQQKVAKATVVRAVVLGGDGQRSQVVTHTFFVDPDMVNRYTFPIVSLVSSPDGLFDDKLGIFVPGDLYRDINPRNRKWNPANFTQLGKKWERPAVIQLFDVKGDLLMEQDIGIRTHGRSSRAFGQKSIRLYAGGYYGSQGLFEYDFFPNVNDRVNDSEVNSFETLVLRTGGGGDWGESAIRDVLIQALLQDLKLDIQGSYPVVLFLDGEYWGIYNLRNRYDEYYFNSYYGIEPDDLIVCEQVQNFLLIGEPGDENLFYEIYREIDANYYTNQYLTVNSLSDPTKYKRITSMMDIENYIDYTISGIYTNKTDWPDLNIMYWRKKTIDQNKGMNVAYGHDGRWRWMVNDFDLAFSDPYNLTLQRVTTEGMKFSFLFRSLLQNQDFRDQFISRFADLLNTTFLEEVVLEKIDMVEDMYLPEMEEHIARWGAPAGSLERWQVNIEEIREFTRQRPDIQRDQLVEYFSLPGLAELTINTEEDAGYVRVNSIDITNGTPGIVDPASWSGVYFQEVPVALSAVAQPGYRFSHWEGLPQGDVSDASLKIMLTGDLIVKAVFTDAP